MEGTICHTVCWNNHPQPPCTLLALLCYQTTECRYKGSDPLRKVTSIEDESAACFSLPSDSPICHRWSERVSTLIFISCIMQECISLQWWRGNICPSRLTQLLTLLLALYTVWQSPCCSGNPLSWRHPVLAYERDPLTYREVLVHLFAISYNTLTCAQLAFALRVGTSSVS